MLKERSDVDSAQGADSPKVEPPSLAQIEKWILRDVSTTIRFLQAIESDVDLRRQMAVWFEGRIQNSITAPKGDPAQSVLFPKPSNS